MASGILRAFLYCSGAGAPDANSDRHNLDHPLPALHGRHRVQTDDRIYKDGRFVFRNCAHTGRAPVCLTTGAFAAPA